MRPDVRKALREQVLQENSIGSLFTKMFVNDDYDQTGLLSSDMLTYEECDKYLAYAAKLDITLETEVKPL